MTEKRATKLYEPKAGSSSSGAPAVVVKQEKKKAINSSNSNTNNSKTIQTKINTRSQKRNEASEAVAASPQVNKATSTSSNANPDSSANSLENAQERREKRNAKQKDMDSKTLDTEEGIENLMEAVKGAVANVDHKASKIIETIRKEESECSGAKPSTSNKRSRDTATSGESNSNEENTFKKKLRAIESDVKNLLLENNKTLLGFLEELRSIYAIRDEERSYYAMVSSHMNRYSRYYSTAYTSSELAERAEKGGYIKMLFNKMVCPPPSNKKEPKLAILTNNNNNNASTSKAKKATTSAAGSSSANRKKKSG